MSYTPSQSSDTPSHASLAGFNKFSREKVLDRRIDRLLYIPSVDVASLAGVGNGGPVTQELGTSEITSIFMADAGDTYSCLWLIPPQADVTKQIDFRILWSQSQSAGTGSCLWKVFYTAITAGGATALTAPASTALDTTISSQDDLGADIPQWTGWGSISANKAGVSSLTPGDDLMLVKLESDTHDTITDVDLIEAQVRYYVKLV
jgi:hypothetical protein